VPANIGEWTPSPGHEPASQWLLDLLHQPRQYSADGRVITATGGRRPSALASTAHALLLRGASIRSATKRIMAAPKWPSAAAAAKRAADHVRATVAELTANTRKHGADEATVGARGGSRPWRSGGSDGHGNFVPLQMLGAGGRAPLLRLRG
jgi:hypothetical protein